MIETSFNVKREIVGWDYESNHKQDHLIMCNGSSASTEAPTFLWAMLISSIILNSICFYMILKIPMLRYIAWQVLQVIPDLVRARFHNAINRSADVESNIREADSSNNANVLTASAVTSIQDEVDQNMLRYDLEPSPLVLELEQLDHAPANQHNSNRSEGQLYNIDFGTSLRNVTSSPQDPNCIPCVVHE